MKGFSIFKQNKRTTIATTTKTKHPALILSSGMAKVPEKTQCIPGSWDD